MEIIFALPLLLLPTILPLLSGLMAKNFGRKFWPWFILGIPLPLIANIILLCLPDKSEKKQPELTTVENVAGYQLQVTGVQNCAVTAN